MAKWANDTLMDTGLAWLRDNTTHQAACSAQPADVAGVGTYGLGTAACGTVAWTLDDGDTTGRKITVAAVNIAVGTSGTVSHVAYYNSGSLLFVGTCVPTAVTAGGTVVLSSYDVDEIRDPA